MASALRNVASGSAVIDDLLASYRWAGGSVTFGFTTSASQYGVNYGKGEATSGYQPLTSLQMTAARDAFASWAELINLKITETSAAAGADIRIASSSIPATAWGYWPGSTATAGDIWMGTTKNFTNPADGNYAKLTFLHEIGHALGLTHPHEPVLTSANATDASAGAICPCCGGRTHGENSGFEASPVLDEPLSVNGDLIDFGTMENYDAIDAMAYSVMSYSSYAGDGHNGYTNGTWDYAQSPMIRDIAAVQYMYGANFQTRSSDTIYSWSAVTGEKFINGAGQGAPGGNKVFETIWDGGGRDTINLSNYTSDLTIDLSPGGWIDFNNSQIANLGKGNFAPGNVAMSLLYEGDVRSLIENAIGGSGNDTIVGNFGGNVLIGGAGNDYIEAIDGHSILGGGTINSELGLLGLDHIAYISVVPTVNGFDGNDTLIGGNGNDIFVVATGSDAIDGYWGIDTLVIDTASANLKLIGTAGSFTIAYGTATIAASNIDFLATKDGIFAISGSDTGIVSPRMVEIQKNISLVYNAGLDRAIDASGLNYWSNMLSNGGSLRELASGIINADEFAKLFGNPKSMNDTSFVQVLYKNVLDREGEAGGLNYWVGTLASGANTRADVLVGFSLSEENRAAVGNNIPKMQVDGSGNPVELVAVTQTQWHDLWA